MPQQDELPDEFLWNIHSYLNEYIRFADTKAEIVIGWTSAVIGLLIAGKYQSHFAWTIPGVVAAIGLLFLVISFMLAFQVVIPNLRSTQAPGYIFWQNIVAHKTKQEFVSKVVELTPKQQANQVAEHLYDLSNVAVRKYKWVNPSIPLALVGSVICGAMFFYFHCT